MLTKFKFKTKEEWDALGDSINYNNVPYPQETWYINPFVAIWQFIMSLCQSAKEMLSSKLPNTLGNLSLGAYLTICQTEQPSKIVELILQDLDLKYVTLRQQVSLYKVWKEQLETITKKVENAQPNINGNAVHKAIWQQCNENHKLPPHLWLVDNMAKRFNLSYADTYKLKISDVIIALSIDACNAEYSARVMDYEKQQSKAKRK